MMKNHATRLFLLLGSMVFSIPGLVAAENPLPRVTMDGGIPVLHLPEALAHFITVKFPDLRIPGKEDMTSGWATFRGKQEVPYGCWGDFNGDGLTDVALILLGKGYWRLLAFHQLKDGSYAALKLEEFPGPDDLEYTQVHPAQEDYLATLKAGRSIRIGGKLLSGVAPKFDAITLFMINDPSSAVMYDWTDAPDAENADYRRNGLYGVSCWGEFVD